jgi:hypothetical protein
VKPAVVETEKRKCGQAPKSMGTVAIARNGPSTSAQCARWSDAS